MPTMKDTKLTVEEATGEDEEQKVTLISHISSPGLDDKVAFKGGHITLNRSKSDRSASLSFVLPITLTWKDIQVSVEIPGKKRCFGETQPAVTKHILRGVSGVAKAGDLLAIMGASGAGKSTLLNVLTGRNVKSYQLNGDVRLNGFNLGSSIRDVSAYVQQDDLFISTLTVREQLQFRALLRMDRQLSREERMARVEEVIVEMGLSKCATSRIGQAGGNEKGLSGGERKRLSFASESLTNPPVFFCDEPTSGLDTFMAQNIVQTLKNMAAKGHTILCTIHQPSSELFSMFSRILLLAEGRTAFMGSSSAAIEFFERQNYPCPTNYNPADHYILTLAIVPGKEEESKMRANAICDSFEESEGSANIKSAIQMEENKGSTHNSDPIIEQATAAKSKYHSSWLTQFRYLFWRSWISLFRDVLLFRVRVMQTLVVALVLGLVYLRITVDQKGVQDVNGAIFLLITNLSFTNIFAVVNSFPLELSVFMREYGTGLYRVDTYYLAKTISEIPLFLGLGISFITLCYWMMGLNEEWEKYLIALGTLLLVANVAVSLGYLISTLCGSVTVALAVAPPLLIPFMLFGGLFVNSDNIPVYFIWLEYVSWFKYANEVLMVNQWNDYGIIPCDYPQPNTTSLIMQYLSQANTSSTPQPGPNRRCAYGDGQDILNYLTFDSDNLVMDICLIIVLLVAFRLLSLVALFIRARRSKG